MDSLRSEIGKWNLASDKKLYQLLERFTDDLISKTKNLQNDLDGLQFETKAAELKLNNCFTGLMMLSSSQFVENRVYDDEPEDQDAKNKATEEPLAESTEDGLIPKFTAALKAGLAALAFYSQPVPLDQIPGQGTGQSTPAAEEKKEEEKSDSESDSDEEGKDKEKKRKKRQKRGCPSSRGSLERYSLTLCNRNTCIFG